MKTIPLLLAMLFFSLSVIPCSDGHTCEEEKMTAEHQHSKDEKDHCTPICICSCCGVTYTIPQPTEYIEQLNTLTTTHNFFYKKKYSFSFQISIWHPPASILV